MWEPTPKIRLPVVTIVEARSAGPAPLRHYARDLLPRATICERKALVVKQRDRGAGRTLAIGMTAALARTCGGIKLEGMEVHTRGDVARGAWRWRLAVKPMRRPPMMNRLPPLGKRRRFLSGCGLLHGCICLGRASSAMAQSRWNLGQPRALNVMQGAAACTGRTLVRA